MYDMNRRLKKVEDKLKVDKEQQVAEIVMFSDGPLPPDRTCGNLIIRHVRYTDICKPTMKDNEKQP